MGDDGLDLVRDLWRCRLRLARPGQRETDYNRAIENIMASPRGGYAHRYAKWLIERSQVPQPQGDLSDDG